MPTDFNAFWSAILLAYPAVRDATVVAMPVEDFKTILRHAFAAGIDHHAALTRSLKNMATEEHAHHLGPRDPSDQARDQLLGPQSLHRDFEAIFGPVNY